MENPPPPTNPRIGLLPGNGRPRRSARNRAGGEKSHAGTRYSTNDETNSHQPQEHPETGLSVPSTSQAQAPKRMKWSKEDYSNVIKAYYTAQENPAEGITKDTYSLWRQIVGDAVRQNITATKLANVRRDILNNNRLSPDELSSIKATVEPREALLCSDAVDEPSADANP